MKKYTVATWTTILGDKMKSRLEVITAENEEEAVKIYNERHPRLENSEKAVEEYRW